MKILKKITPALIALMISLSTLTFGQNAKSFSNTPYKTRNSGSFGRHTGLLTFSYGFPNLPISGYSYIGNDRLGVGPFYVKYEHSIMDEVGIGGQSAFSIGRYRYSADERERIRVFHAAALGYYHFNKLIPVKQLDVYAGAGFGLRVRSVDYTDNTFYDNTHEDVYLVAKAGVRFYPKGPVAIYAEAGYDDMSAVNFGATFKLR